MVIYPFESLFSGNQNIYFLWGAAKAGFGNLQADPMLLQADPYPAFTFLASTVFKLLPIAAFQLIYWLLNSVYTYSLFGIADKFTGIYSGIRTLALFSVLFLTLHSTQLWGSFFETALGADLRWIWDSGLAEQGVLRGYLQPSVFGVFLLLGALFLVEDKPIYAALSFGLAGAVHANYLALSGLMLGFAAIVLLVRKELTRKQATAMAVFVVVTLPYLIYVAQHFLANGSAEVQATVESHFDDHLHFDPSTWLNAKTLIQGVVFLLFLWMFRKTPLGKWIRVITQFTIVISVLALVIPKTPLLSLTPWRVSVVLFPIGFSIMLGLLSQSLRPGRYVPLILMPLSAMLVSLLYFRVMGSSDPEFLFGWKVTTLIFVVLSVLIAWFIRIMARPFQIHLNNVLAMSLLLLLLTTGAVGKWMELRTKQNAEWSAVKEYVNSSAQPEDLYLVPLSFKGFRMNAGPVYSDQLLVHGATLPDQYDRISFTDRFYSNSTLNSQDRDDLRQKGITHVVLPVNSPADGTEVFQDDHFRVVQLDR